MTGCCLVGNAVLPGNCLDRRSALISGPVSKGPVSRLRVGFPVQSKQNDGGKGQINQGMGNGSLWQCFPGMVRGRE